MKRLFIYIIFILFVNPVLAFSAAYTSSQSGNWSNVDTWGGSGPPTNGDTVTINHPVTVDSNTTIGTSGAAGTLVVTVDKTSTNTGSLTVASGISLTVRGDFQLKNATLTLSAGSSYIFDSSLASGTPIYKILLGSATSGQTENKIVANGTYGSHVSITKADGSGQGVICRYTNGGVATSLTATYTDFANLGTATAGYGTDAIEINPIQTGQEFSLDHCTFTNLSRIYLVGCGAANNLSLTNNRWISIVPSSGYGFWLIATAKTSGSRIVTDNVHEIPIAGWSWVIGTAGLYGYTFERNIFNRIDFTGTHTAGLESFDNNLLYIRSSNTVNNNSEFGCRGETLQNSYMILDQSVEGSYITFYDNGTSGASVILDGWVYENSNGEEGSDFIHSVSPATPTVLSVKNCLIIPNNQNFMSGTITFHGNNNVTCYLENNTIQSSTPVGGSATAQAGIYIGSGYSGRSDFINKFRNNLFWSDTASSVGYGYAIWLSNSYWPITGIADSGTTSSLVDSNPSPSGFSALGTNPKLVITSKSGSGPEVGESAIISSVVSNTLNLATTLSAAPDTGTGYKVSVVDALTLANTDYNAMFGLNNGTVYDSIGANGTSKMGYDGFWLSGSIASNDISLSISPKFRDKTRNFATYDSARLGNSQTAWATATSYNIGDYVSASDSSFYNGVTINYRCIKAHTSSLGDSTNGKPGVASSYRTNWEFATIERLRNDTSRIEDLVNWVKLGFQPTNGTLKGSGYGNADISAVPVYFRRQSIM